jgi:hypothetical protein
LFDRSPPELLAVRAGTRKTGHYSLADHGALKLGKDPEHLEHRAARGCGCVQTLLVQKQINPLGPQLRPADLRD